MQPLTPTEANINATVFEREAPETYLGRSREWGMSLHWGSEAVNRVLPPALQARIKEIWCDPHFVQQAGEHRFLPHYAGHTGEQLFATPADDAMRVSRSKMRKLFSEDIDIKVTSTCSKITLNEWSNAESSIVRKTFGWRE